MNYADPFERFRIGDGEGSWNADPAKRRELPGSQLPVEAYDNYMKQAVPRWLSTDKAVVDAYWRRAPIRSRRWSPWSRRWAAIATRWNP